MTLILINGYAGAGKDTFVKFFSEEAEKQGKRVVNLSSITPVWKMLKNQGIDMDRKGPEERKLAAEVKAALDNYNFLATKMALDSAWTEFVKGNDIVFIHMREPRAFSYGEMYWTRYSSKHDCRTLFIDRPQPALTVGNVADDSVRLYTYKDHVANYGSLRDFQEAAVNYFYHLRMLP